MGTFQNTINPPWGSANVSLAHETRIFTNEKIQELNDEELRYFIYTNPKKEDGIKMEKYRRNEGVGSRVGEKVGDVFWGLPRCLLELQKRHKQRLDESIQRTNDQRESFNALMLEENQN